MDWGATSRSQYCARGSGVGMGTGIGMDWCPGSRSHSRSRPSWLPPSEHGFEFDDAANSNSRANSTANTEQAPPLATLLSANGSTGFIPALLTQIIPILQSTSLLVGPVRRVVLTDFRAPKHGRYCRASRHVRSLRPIHSGRNGAPFGVLDLFIPPAGMAMLDIFPYQTLSATT